MELSEEHVKAVAVALTEGQGGFSKEELVRACNEIAESLIAGEMAALALQGTLVIRFTEGELKYETSSLGRADLEGYLKERGISAEQFSEEMRRGE
jgi:hypothetical protein